MKLTFNSKTMEKLYNITPILKKDRIIIVDGKKKEGWEHTGRVILKHSKDFNEVTIVPPAEYKVDSESIITKVFTNKDDAIEYFKKQVKEMFEVQHV